MPKAEWVKMGPEPYLATCERCGETVEKPRLPTPLRAFVKYLEYAIEEHRLCAKVRHPRRKEAV